MANHASAKKSIRQSVKRNLLNKSRSSKIKTFVKKLLNLINLGAKEDAVNFFPLVQSEIMRGAKKNVFKINTASRKVSKLATKMKKMQARAS